MFKVIFCIIILSKSAFGGFISIPLDNSDFKYGPAGDLVYAGEVINEARAIELAKQGVDLSSLEVKETSLYGPKSLPFEAEAIGNSNQGFIFDSLLRAPTEYFRASIKQDGVNYTLNASIFNHETLLRAAILRSIGYKSNLPSYYPLLRISFQSKLQKENFKEALVQGTLLGLKRWIHQENDLEIILKEIVLEPAEQNTVPVYWPVMESSRQKRRRSFRALLYLYSLTNFEQEVNKTPWSLGSIFDQRLHLNQDYSHEFTHVTLDDLIWIHKKISKLTETQMRKIVSYASYPEPVSKIYFEKLKSRINSFGKLFKLEESFQVNLKLSGPYIKNAKLINYKNQNSIVEYWAEDPSNPFRFSEILKLFRNQITYDTLSGFLDNIQEKFLPNITTEEAYKEIVKNIRNSVQKEGAIPLKVWAHPTAQGGISGSRSIVFGRYLGNKAPIQLVDSLSYKVKAGIFASLSGVSNITPTGGVDLKLERNWVHIKAMEDLTHATSESIKGIVIPQLFKSLGKILNTASECDISKNVWVGEEIIAGIQTFIVYYDSNFEGSKEEALQERNRLIENGAEGSRILLRPENKDRVCDLRVIEKRSKKVETFLKQFAMDETFTITDSLVKSARVGVKGDLSFIDQLTAEINMGRNKAQIRSTSFKRIEGGVEITLQNQANLGSSLEEGIKFFITLVSNNHLWLKGKVNSQVYRIRLDGVGEEEKKTGLNVLREIMLLNRFDLLKESYNPIALDQKVAVKLNTFKYFWKKTDVFNMNHFLEIKVPNKLSNFPEEEEEISEWDIPSQPRGDLTDKERTRLLFSSLRVERKGRNYHKFVDDILNDQVEWLELGSTSGDPGTSLFGESLKRYDFVEGDITNEIKDPVYKFERVDLGWSANPNKVDFILKSHEMELSSHDIHHTVDRSFLNHTNNLKSYEIRSTLIIYPEGISKIESFLFLDTDKEFLNKLKKSYGVVKWDRFCKRRMRKLGKKGGHIFSFHDGVKYCVPSEFRPILKLRKYGHSNNGPEIVTNIKTLISTLRLGLGLDFLINLVGEENLFGISNITGYREGDSEGNLQFTSSSIGHYNKDFGTGIFDEVSVLLELNPYLIKALNYTPSL